VHAAEHLERGGQRPGLLANLLLHLMAETTELDRVDRDMLPE